MCPVYYFKSFKPGTFEFRINTIFFLLPKEALRTHKRIKRMDKYAVKSLQVVFKCTNQKVLKVFALKKNTFNSVFFKIHNK